MPDEVVKLIRDDVRIFRADNAPEIALEAFRALTDSPAVFIERGSTTEEIFWSRYFWFWLFKEIRVAIDGPDAGLEQQAYQLLEDPFPECEPDWSQVESVEALAHQEAALWLQHRRSH